MEVLEEAYSKRFYKKYNHENTVIMVIGFVFFAILIIVLAFLIFDGPPKISFPRIGK